MPNYAKTRLTIDKKLERWVLALFTQHGFDVPGMAPESSRCVLKSPRMRSGPASVTSHTSGPWWFAPRSSHDPGASEREPRIRN